MTNNDRKNPHPGKGTEFLAIGDLAAATGLSPDTIRVWERRYGAPVPTRLPSGHRRYEPWQVRWLRRVAEAMSHGARPSKVLRLSEQELDRLLQDAAGQGRVVPEVEDDVKLLLDFRGEKLIERLDETWRRVTPDSFLQSRVGPLVTAVGRLWSDGELQVRHEHYFTNLMAEYLVRLRASFNGRVSKGRVLLTTLSGEPHSLGLQMVALLCAAHGHEPRILGTDTPIDEIVAAVGETGATVVGISISLATGGVETDRTLAALRRSLPQHVHILIGGMGARGVRRGPRGVDYVQGFTDLGQWFEKPPGGTHHGALAGPQSPSS